MSVLLEFSMTPLDKGESVSKYVARSTDLIGRLTAKIDSVREKLGREVQT